MGCGNNKERFVVTVCYAYYDKAIIAHSKEKEDIDDAN